MLIGRSSKGIRVDLLSLSLWERAGVRVYE
jgi:hypothetical protein